jgi:hypothetical protein
MATYHGVFICKVFYINIIKIKLSIVCYRAKSGGSINVSNLSHPVYPCAAVMAAAK